MLTSDLYVCLSQGLVAPCVRSTLMSAPALLARMEPSALTVPTDTNAAALKVSMHVCICVCVCKLQLMKLRLVLSSKSKPLLLTRHAHLCVAISGSDTLLCDHTAGQIEEKPLIPLLCPADPNVTGSQRPAAADEEVTFGRHPDICSSITHNEYPHSAVWHDQSSQRSLSHSLPTVEIDLSKKVFGVKIQYALYASPGTVGF